MTKDPYVPWYFRDFIVSTDLMTLEQVGAHTRLLCHQADKGHLYEDSIRERIPQPIWDAIKVRWKQDNNGFWYHPRMEKELKKREMYIKKRVQNLMGKQNG